MGVKESFANRLKQLREEKSLSQTQIADKLGVSRGSISFYENGDRTPDIEILAKVQNYFNVSFDYLLGKSEYRDIEEKEFAETQTQKFEKLFNEFDADFHDIFQKDIIKILSIEDEKAKRDLMWNITIVIGFHLRILDLYNEYCNMALIFKDTIDSEKQVRLNTIGYHFPNDKNPDEIYFLLQNSFISQALNEDRYIYEETQGMIKKLYDHICKLNNLKDKYGDKYEFSMPRVQDYPHLNPKKFINDNKSRD